MKKVFLSMVNISILAEQLSQIIHEKMKIIKQIDLKLPKTIIFLPRSYGPSVKVEFRIKQVLFFECFNSLKKKVNIFSFPFSGAGVKGPFGLSNLEGQWYLDANSEIWLTSDLLLRRLPATKNISFISTGALLSVQRHTEKGLALKCGWFELNPNPTSLLLKLNFSFIGEVHFYRYIYVRMIFFLRNFHSIIGFPLS